MGREIFLFLMASKSLERSAQRKRKNHQVPYGFITQLNDLWRRLHLEIQKLIENVSWANFLMMSPRWTLWQMEKIKSEGHEEDTGEE